MTPTMFELFDHTADMGIRARAGTLAGLVAPAAEGLYAVIGNLAGGGRTQHVTFEFAGDDPALLLRDYLSELLLAFDRDRYMAVEHTVREFLPGRLWVEATFCLIDEQNSLYEREVKAVTYHELKIVEISGGFEATIIVDI